MSSVAFDKSVVTRDDDKRTISIASTKTQTKDHTTASHEHTFVVEMSHLSKECFNGLDDNTLFAIVQYSVIKWRQRVGKKLHSSNVGSRVYVTFDSLFVKLTYDRDKVIKDSKLQGRIDAILEMYAEEVIPEDICLDKLQKLGLSETEVLEMLENAQD